MNLAEPSNTEYNRNIQACDSSPPPRYLLTSKPPSLSNTKRVYLWGIKGNHRQGPGLSNVARTFPLPFCPSTSRRRCAPCLFSVPPLYSVDLLSECLLEAAFRDPVARHSSSHPFHSSFPPLPFFFHLLPPSLPLSLFFRFEFQTTTTLQLQHRLAPLP